MNNPNPGHHRTTRNRDIRSQETAEQREECRRRDREKKREIRTTETTKEREKRPVGDK